MDRYNGTTNQGQKSDYEGRPVNTDPVRYAIGEGLAYRLGYQVGDLASTGSIEILFDPTTLVKTATKGKLFVQSTQDIKIEFYHDPIVTANGTPIPVHNFNRLSDASCNTLIYHTPSVSAPGTKYAPDLFAYVGTWGVGVNITTATPFISSDEFSVILNPDKKYYYKIVNLNAEATAKIAIEFRLVEEPNYPLG